MASYSSGVAGEALPVVHRRRLGLVPAYSIVVLVGALVIVAVATNHRFGWPTVWQYLFSSTIVRGVGVTVQLTAIAMGIGILLGIVFAVMKQSGAVLLAAPATAYTWFFRGTPQLVQLIFWYNIGALYPTFVLGVPSGPQLFSVEANSVVTPMATAIIGLGLNEGAYMAEIVRAGLLSVGAGQREAADALGLSRWQSLTRIVLPQAMRVIIPPTGNQVISMLKSTSLVSVIALSELLHSAESIYSRTFETIPLLIVVSLWYLALTSVLSIGQYYLEQHFTSADNRSRRTLPAPAPAR
jgi:polar amino acid transport system permease protein